MNVLVSIITLFLKSFQWRGDLRSKVTHAVTWGAANYEGRQIRVKTIWSTYCAFFRGCNLKYNFVMYVILQVISMQIFLSCQKAFVFMCQTTVLKFGIEEIWHMLICYFANLKH